MQALQAIGGGIASGLGALGGAVGDGVATVVNAAGIGGEQTQPTESVVRKASEAGYSDPIGDGPQGYIADGAGIQHPANFFINRKGHRRNQQPTGTADVAGLDEQHIYTNKSSKQSPRGGRSSGLANQS